MNAEVQAVALEIEPPAASLHLGTSASAATAPDRTGRVRVTGPLLALADFMAAILTVTVLEVLDFVGRVCGPTRSRIDVGGEGVRLLFEAEDRFDLQIFLQPERAHRPADAGLLVAAHRGK